jgi:2-polyprenyl-3-methyl-5-hydroxy-6-metoxy-1,4-benzoquinol methylase
MLDVFCPRPMSVLDVGCGEGILKNHLPPSASYFGIEPSREASSSAMRKAGRECIFHGTAEQFDASGRKWAAIIFNEMLYYTAKPVETVQRLDVLTPGGIRIVSIFQKPESVKQRLSRFVGRPSMSNLLCAELVLNFAAEQGWRIEANEVVNSCWRIFTLKT